MRNPKSVFLAVTLASAWSASAGDAVAEPRKQFKQSSVYPFVFRPECYLATTGPKPMRFAPPAPECGKRNPPVPPPPIVPPKTEPAVPESKAGDVPPPQAAPAFPPPADGQPPKADAHDFTRVPDEVLDFFKNTEGRPIRREYLFDPIFQPALPNDLPKSKATYQQKK